MVSILFFGRLKEELGCGQLDLQLESEVSVTQLKRQLVAQNPQWQDLLLDDQVLVAVDQIMATDSVMVSTTAEVAFFPPVTGG